ncbi:MAG: DMT family transporter [Candidatus Hodarchaeota archaeon]
MSSSLYWLGVLFAIVSGVLNNFGTVLQKKVVNDLPSNAKFFRSLVKQPLWFLGFLLQIAIGSIFFMLAQVYIGPALIPGLMALGLVVLALGSIKIVGEKLHKSEVFGIVLMIIGITLLGFSELSIAITETNISELGFITRVILFTIISCSIAIVFWIISLQKNKTRGMMLALYSGMMFVLSNFWISPLMGTITNVFAGNSNSVEIVIFVASCIILVLSNMIGMLVLQQAFQSGQASNLIPIQQVPIQIGPIFVYFMVFLLIPPSTISVLFLAGGVVAIITSSFLLGKRQSKIEQIK